MMQVLGGRSRLTFSHPKHVKERKLECDVCHAGSRDSDRAGMPDAETCDPCHGESDLKKPPRERASAFYEGGKTLWTNTWKLSPEVIFSHKAHAEKGVACEECHRGIVDEVGVRPGLALSMQECVDCHGKKGALKECAACHKTIRKDAPPVDHRLNWEVIHGQKVRDGAEARARCGLCHQDDSCSRCHNEEKPRSHTNYWRIRGHGAMAGIDRDRCQTCHRSDFCVRCHQETKPMSHVGTWGANRDRHCLSCHFPLGSETRCTICHKDAPSHLMATPKPSWHTPAMNCRQCHGAGQSLPHSDNGSNCNSCHR